MRLGLTYDLQMDPTDPRQAEFDPPRVLDAVEHALQALGHDVVRLGHAEALVRRPTVLQTLDLVWNLAEGRHGRNREAWTPILLELFGVPYVGSDALALSLGLDKAACKRLANVAGIPTPPWVMIAHPAAVPPQLPFPFPAIVKPRYQGSGIGIDPGAVVHDREALAARLQWLMARWPEPALVEAFIPQGELTVCLIGNDPPIAYPTIQRTIDPTSRLSCHVVSSRDDRWETPLELSAALDAQARRLALAMFREVGCCDVARVDVRVDDRGGLWFLEINPLPSFDPEGSFGLLAEHLELSYPVVMGRILEAASRRLHLKTSAPASVLS